MAYLRGVGGEEEEEEDGDDKDEDEQEDEAEAVRYDGKREGFIQLKKEISSGKVSCALA